MQRINRNPWRNPRAMGGRLKISERRLMPIPLTAEMLAHAYDYLACQPPFSKWNLPPSEDVKFSISKNKYRFAHYQMIGGIHHLVFSSRFIGRHELLIAT